MNTAKFTVTLKVEIADQAIITREQLLRMELNIEGAVTGTLLAQGVGINGVSATIYREREA